MPRKRKTQRGTETRPSKHERIFARAMRDVNKASREARTSEAIKAAPKRSDTVNPCDVSRLMSKGARGVTTNNRGLLNMPYGTASRYSDTYQVLRYQEKVERKERHKS